MILEEGDEGVAADAPEFCWACCWELRDDATGREKPAWYVDGVWLLSFVVRRALDFCAPSNYSISDVTSLIFIYPELDLSNIWKTVWYSPLSTLTY